MTKRTFLFFVPAALFAVTAPLMSLSLRLGFALLVLTMLGGLGIGVWELHRANVERKRRDQYGEAPEPARSAWVAAGRWLARH